MALYGHDMDPIILRSGIVIRSRLFQEKDYPQEKNYHYLKDPPPGKARILFVSRILLRSRPPHIL